MMDKLVIIAGFFVLVLILSGCRTTEKNVRVVVSPSEVKEYRMTIEDGQNIVCDPQGCKVLR